MNEKINKPTHAADFIVRELSALMGEVSGSDEIVIEHALIKARDLRQYLRRIAEAQRSL